MGICSTWQKYENGGNSSLYTAINIHDYREMLERREGCKTHSSPDWSLFYSCRRRWLAVHSYTSLCWIMAPLRNGCSRGTMEGPPLHQNCKEKKKLSVQNLTISFIFRHLKCCSRLNIYSWFCWRKCISAGLDDCVQFVVVDWLHAAKDLVDLLFPEQQTSTTKHKMTSDTLFNCTLWIKRVQYLPST